MQQQQNNNNNNNNNNTLQQNNGEKLAEIVQNTMENPPWEALRKGRDFHMGCCDGRTTQRILSHIQKISEKRSMSCRNVFLRT